MHACTGGRSQSEHHETVKTKQNPPEVCREKRWNVNVAFRLAVVTLWNRKRLR